jgi:hypothetical protein
LNDINEHIASLSIGTETEDVQATELHDIQHDLPDLPDGGTFDQPDTTFDTEQHTESSEVSSQGANETQEEVNWQERYEEAQKAAEGRLAEIGNLRTDMRAQRENIEQMRQMWLKEQEARAEEERQKEAQAQYEAELEQYGEDVVNDPHVSYMRDKMSQVEWQLEQQRQEQEGRVRTMQEQAAQARAQEEYRRNAIMEIDRQEKGFAEEHPDYEDAYKYAREKRGQMYARRGYTPEQVEQAVAEEEIYLMQEQLSRGGSVPQEIYNWALDYGWTAPSDTADNQRSERPQDRTSDFDKIRAGVTGQGVRTMNGAGGNSGDAQYISMEQFYKTVPEHIRAEVHADPDKFEQLAKTGKIRVDW